MTLDEIAHRYRISISAKDVRLDIGDFEHHGPMGGGYTALPFPRAVRLHPRWRPSRRAVYGLHEIAHCVLHHPELGPDIAEAYVLLAFERALFRHLAVSRDEAHATRAEFYRYQASGSFADGNYTRTVSEFFGTHGDWLRSEWHAEALGRAKKLGVLDDRGAVTWEYPRWSRSRDYDRWLARADRAVNDTHQRCV